MEGKVSTFELQKELGHHNTPVCHAIEICPVIMQFPEGLSI
jgi:hypothetical protein